MVEKDHQQYIIKYIQFQSLITLEIDHSLIGIYDQYMNLDRGRDS